MAQELLTIYKADVNQYVADVNKAVQSNLALGNTQNNVQKELNETTKAADKLGNELAGTARTAKSSTDNLKGFSKTAKSELAGLRQSVRTVGIDIATTLGAAFAVNSVIEFGKASVNAFLEAQENAEKLRFAVTQIAGESDQAFQNLINQSEELQSVSIFSDDSIQQAQAALATFGLTSAKIEEIIPLLADFATITGQDIPQAAQALGQAIQGRAGEFKKFGVDVSESSTEVENLANILSVLKTQQGAATQATKTFAGQIKQAKNAIDDLQESIGEGIVAYIKTFIDTIKPSIDKIIDNVSKLFGIFRSGKEATDQASSGLETLKTVVEVITLPLRGLLAVAGLVTDGILLLARTASGAASAIKVAFNGIANTVKSVGTGVAGVIDGITSFDASKIKAAAAKITAPIKDLGSDIKDAFNEGFKLDVVKEVEKAVSDTVVAEEKLFTQRELQKKSVKELNQLLKDYGKINTVTGRSNLKLIQDEIDARKKQTEELEKELAKQLEELKRKNGGVDKLTPKDINAAFDEETVVPVNPVPLEVEPRIVGATEFNDGIEAIEAKTFKGWVENNDRMLTATEQLVNDVAALYDVMSERQIDALERSTEKQIDLLNSQAEKNSESLKKRRISETEFAIQQEKIEKEKVRVQDETDKKIRAIKRKQAIADKAAALIAIAINTARAYAETLGQTGIAGLALGELIIAAGLAQAAVVAAQPIPYKKGSKDTGGSGHLALVGEEGPELVHMRSHSQVLPSKQTKTYGEAINAMFDNRFDQWAMSEYLPRLIQSSPSIREQSGRRESFVDNVAASAPVNFGGLTASQFERFWRNGSPVTNADHIGKSVAKYLKEDIYRR